MKLQARRVLPPGSCPPGTGHRISELHDAVNCSYEPNWNGVRSYQEGLFFGPPMERRAENSQRQTCKLGLIS